MMEKQISPQTEKRMTRAIEKAAALALVQPEANRSKLLADALLGADVENCFAKTASAAFNRRLTVLRFQKTADEHKADTFPLSDGDEVLALMGGQADMPKVAAEMSVMEGPFEMTVTKYDDGTIVKTAKAEVTRPLYEETVTYPHFEKHINSVLQANAAAFSREMGKLYKKATELEREREEVVSMVKNASPFEFKMLCNVFGHDMALHFCDELPEGTDFSKTASVINPHTELFEKVASFILHENEYIQTHNDMVDYKEGLEEFGKVAAEVASGMRKTAIPAAAALAGMAIRTIPAATDSMYNALNSARKEYGGALENAYGQALAMDRAGTDSSVSPNSLLNSKFLTKERFRDRLLAWSDMTADPVLAKYDAAELFRAVQKAMDTHPALERPDHRETLRTYVTQILPQNSMQSLADIAALDTMEKARAAGPQGGVEESAEAVKELNKEEAPTPPTENSLITALKTVDAVDGSTNISAKEFNDKDWEKIKASKKEKSEAAEKEKAAEEKNLREFMDKARIKPEFDSKGKFIGYKILLNPKGTSFRRISDINAIRDAYESYKSGSDILSL